MLSTPKLLIAAIIIFVFGYYLGSADGREERLMLRQAFDMQEQIIRQEKTPQYQQRERELPFRTEGF